MSELIVEQVGSVCVLTLNRPEKRNALNDELIVGLKEALNWVGDDNETRAVVIRGAGKDFCSGADLAALRKIADASFEENLDDARQLADLFAMIRGLPIPVIAAVHGRALAGGCGLASSCDVVLAAENSRFGYPEVKIGFVPAIVLAILRRNVSEKQAFEMTTRGFEFDAPSAVQFGLANKVISEEGFAEAAIEYARGYETVSSSAVRMTKKLLYDMDARSFEDAVDLGVQVNAEARMTDDCKRGISKFLDR